MLIEASHCREECAALYALLNSVPPEFLQQLTQFKSWTVEDIVGHLLMFDTAARLTLTDTQAFRDLMNATIADLSRGRPMQAVTRDWLRGLSGHALLERWRLSYQELCDLYSAAEPTRRVSWAGPDMSVRSCISARQMETWAHGQAAFDALGQVRVESDRVRNIAVMGINTFAWTFANRGWQVPVGKPYVRLSAPSGALWEWHEPADAERIEGSAVDFCRVVTQTRNVLDTGLRVVGETAVRWMSHAQCFAGPASAPPSPGTRFPACLPA
jgi:uncharacterized protein (TIGR03084 family)